MKMACGFKMALFLFAVALIFLNFIYRGENVIMEIIFSDCYRTFLLCTFSIVLAFAMRNASTKKEYLQ